MCQRTQLTKEIKAAGLETEGQEESGKDCVLQNSIQENTNEEGNLSC